MIHEVIKLKELYNIQTEAYLEVIIPHNDDAVKRRVTPGIIVVPGGAYECVSVREADPVAFKLAIEGYATFVLHYSTKTPYPTPMLELAYAIAHLRKNSSKYYLDENKLGLIGFSAGGHLVSSYGYLYEHKLFLKHIDLSPETIKPNFLICSYPVITMKNYTHQQSMKNITNMDPKLIELLSVEDHISPNYPPTFVWTTGQDNCVNPINSTMFVEALKKNNVKHEFFYYPNLDHGLSVLIPLLYPQNILNEKEVKEVASWFDKAISFINNLTL